MPPVYKLLRKIRDQKENLTLTVEFTKCNVRNSTDTVNHAMFYVSDSENSTIHYVHCTPGRNDQYYVEIKPKSYKVPRNPVGEGFAVQLTEITKETISGAALAGMLAELPPPSLGNGGCQWWILTNLHKMEQWGLIKPGTTVLLLIDKRMDSSRLMEFQDAKLELQCGMVTGPEIELMSEAEVHQLLDWFMLTTTGALQGLPDMEFDDKKKKLSSNETALMDL